MDWLFDIYITLHVSSVIAYGPYIPIEYSPTPHLRLQSYISKCLMVGPLCYVLLSLYTRCRPTKYKKRRRPNFFWFCNRTPDEFLHHTCALSSLACIATVITSSFSPQLTVPVETCFHSFSFQNITYLLRSWLALTILLPQASLRALGQENIGNLFEHPCLSCTDTASIRVFFRSFDNYVNDVIEISTQMVHTDFSTAEIVFPVSLEFCIGAWWL